MLAWCYDGHRLKSHRQAHVGPAPWYGLRGMSGKSSFPGSRSMLGKKVLRGVWGLHPDWFPEEIGEDRIIFTSAYGDSAEVLCLKSGGDHEKRDQSVAEREITAKVGQRVLETPCVPCVRVGFFIPNIVRDQPSSTGF